MARIKGLGRGLDALLASNEEQSNEGQLRELSLSKIRPGKYQPRTRMDQESLAELAQSIKTQGLMQPILVRAVENDGYEIIAGERRWRAAQIAGLNVVPALVRDVPDQAALALALVENIQREDLNPLEEAQGLHRLISEFLLTHDEVAQVIGRSRSAVTNLLRLTQLAAPVQEMMMSGELEMGHARALLGLPQASQIALARVVAAKGLSVRETERLVQRQPAQDAKKKATPSRDPDLARLQEELAEALGAPVHLQAKRKGAGRLIIDYATLDILDGILTKLLR